MQLEVGQKKLGKFAKRKTIVFLCQTLFFGARRYSLSLEREGGREGGGIAHPQSTNSSTTVPQVHALGIYLRPPEEVKCARSRFDGSFRIARTRGKARAVDGQSKP